MILDGAVRREEALASMKRISEFLVQRFGTCMVCDVVELGVPMMIPYSPQRASTPGGLSELSLKESKIKALYANEVVRARRFYEYRAGASKSLDKRAMAEATEFKSFMAPEYAMASKRQSYYERTAYARGTTVEEVRAQRVEAAMKTMGVGRPVQMGLVLPQEKRLAVIRVWRDLTGDKLSSTWRSAGSPSGNEPLISIEEFFPENVDSATLDSFLNGLRHNCRADGVPIDVVKTGVPIGLYDMLESTMRACPTFIENTGSKTKDEFSQGHRTEVARADALKRRDGDGYRTVPKPSRAGMHEPETIENASVPGINMDAPVLAPDPAASSVDSGISSLPPHMRRAYVEEVVRRHRERLAAVPEAAAAAGAHSTERGPYA
jgi:hypothetical protein